MSEIEIPSIWINKLNKSEVKVTGINLEEDGCLFVSYDEVESGDSGGLVKDFFLQNFDCKKQVQKSENPKAVQILNEAVAIMAERGKSYDKSGGEAERSMPKIVAMFNALTSHELTPAQGWKFMACLKLARSEQGEHREDNYLDGAAYMALAGEEAEASE